MARILVVDDVAMNRRLVHAILEDAGHVLIDAESGERALTLVAEEHPELVLVDVMMPGLDGFEVTRRIKELAHGDFLPVVMLTSLTDAESRLHGPMAGADDFLSKPVAREELLLRVRNLLQLRADREALRQQNTELMALVRFREELSALIVHDLRSPVSAITLNLDYLREAIEGNPDPPYLEALEDSRNAGRRVLALLSNLLDTTRIESGRASLRRGPITLAELLGGAADRQRFASRVRTIHIDVTVDPALIVEADEDLLTRVVDDIVENAVRYTPARGRIDLRARHSAGAMQLRIGNTGTAIPEEARSVIFEKFGQIRPGRGRRHLGLGLYFCRLAVEAHGGRIWVEEEPPLSTVFVLELPVRAEEPRAAALL